MSSPMLAVLPGAEQSLRTLPDFSASHALIPSKLLVVSRVQPDCISRYTYRSTVEHVSQTYYI